MRAIILIFLIFIFGSELSAQRYLAVDLYRLGTFKRFSIYEGSMMKFKLKENHRMQKNKLVALKDSTLFFEDGTMVPVSDIKCVVVNRSHVLLQVLRRVLVIAGVGFIGLDTFNNAINGESPVFKEQVLTIGGSLFLAGQLLKLTETKRVRPGRNKRIHIIDNTM